MNEVLVPDRSESSQVCRFRDAFAIQYVVIYSTDYDKFESKIQIIHSPK